MSTPTRSRWLAMRLADGSLFVTMGDYTFEEALRCTFMPVCPLADVQAGDCDAADDLRVGMNWYASGTFRDPV